MLSWYLCWAPVFFWSSYCLWLSMWGLHNLLGSVWSVFYVLLVSVQRFCVLLVLLLLMWGFHLFPVRCFHILLLSLWSLHVLLVSVWSIRLLLASEWFSPVSYHSKKRNILSKPVVQRFKTRVVQTRSLRDAFKPGFLTYQIDKAFTWVLA